MRSIVFVIPALLMLPTGAAMAQASGSYRGSCTNINQNGSTLSALCRGAGGMFETSIDLDRCGRMGIANSGGRLTCGNVRGSARPAGRGDDFGTRSGPGFGDEGGGYPRRPRYDADGGFRQGYGAPDPYARRPRYGDPDADYAPRRPRYDPDADSE